MAFHNPYHFVPIKNQERESHLTRSDFENPQSSGHKHVTHDRYVAVAKSGRIICRLTSEEPLVIGAEQGGTAPAKVEPFRIDEKSKATCVSGWARQKVMARLRQS